MGPDTKIYLSFSRNPGSFGASVFNALFSRYGIEAVYLPRMATEPRNIAISIRALGISGCAISSPLKESIVAELDEQDESVRSSGTCNTIVQRGKSLIGYNADIYGATHALRGLPIERVLIYGAGGVVPSVVRSLRELGAGEIQIHARDQERANARARSLGITTRKLTPPFSLLINCSPASTDVNSELFPLLSEAAGVFDLVVSPNWTPLLMKAQQAKKIVVPGWKMALAQLQRQFFLYEGIDVALVELEDLLRAVYLTKETSA